jgi:ligand-binding SRPBCC domain-containing protein
VTRIGDRLSTFARRTRIAAPAEALWAWHASPDALQKLVPPWEHAEVIGPSGIEEGQQVTLRLRVGPLFLRWVSKIDQVIPGRQFRDVQLHGPFAYWQHTHRFEPAGPDASFLADRIVYALPFGPFGRLGQGLVRRRLERMFDYRHRVTAEALANP